jgi:AraC-like DNA-binding protein
VRCDNDRVGIEKSVELVPDLVIADINPPASDGLRLCRELKSGLITSHIPVVLFALRESEDYQLKALDAGADEYVGRSPGIPAIRERAEKVLNLHSKPRVTAAPGLSIQPREMAANQTDAAFLQKVINVVDQNLSDCEFDVDTLAEKTGISRRQLFRKLKAVLGTTPNSLIRSIRLKRAAQLIVESKMTITEITFAVGFLDLKHFRLMFKDEFGVLPSEYSQPKQPALT